VTDIQILIIGLFSVAAFAGFLWLCDRVR